MEEKKKEKRYTLAKIILGIIILILILLFVRSCAKIGIYLEVEEKKYYVYHSTTFPLPKAKAYDNKGKKLNIEITIYKNGKEKEGIDTNHIGDKYIVYYKTYKRNMYLKKHIEVEIIRNPNLLGYTIEGISNIWTKEDVILKFVPNENNIEKYCVKGECSTNKEFTIEKNETFETYIIDEYGNKSLKQEYEVTNIDKEAPVIKKVTEYNNKGKRYIGVQGEDTLSGVAEYSYDGGKTYSTSSTKEVSSGQIIIIKIKDLVGNESEEYKYTVGNKQIEELPKDTKAPTFKVTRTPEANSRGWNNTNVTLTIKAEDDISGVASYSFDNGDTWETEHIKEYTSTTTVKIKVKDNAGNISESKSVEVKIDKISPKIKAKKESETEYREIVTGTTYDEKIEIEIEEENVHEITFTKDGNVIPLEETISENGLYYIKVEDKAGNIKQVTFTMRLVLGIYIRGVMDGNYYNIDVSPYIEGETTYIEYTKNGALLLTDNLSQSEEGEYYLYVENEYGKSDEVTFTIDKTVPTILSDKSNKEKILYETTDKNLDKVVIFENDSVLTTEEDFIDLTRLLLNESEISINNENEYRIVAIDKAGNITEYAEEEVIPIYTIADLESVGSNTTRAINGEEYFMSSTGSYKLMNDLDYNNQKYNQIEANNQSVSYDYDYYLTFNKNINPKPEFEVERYEMYKHEDGINYVDYCDIDDCKVYFHFTKDGEKYKVSYGTNILYKYENNTWVYHDKNYYISPTELYDDNNESTTYYICAKYIKNQNISSVGYYFESQIDENDVIDYSKGKISYYNEDGILEREIEFDPVTKKIKKEYETDYHDLYNDYKEAGITLPSENFTIDFDLDNAILNINLMGENISSPYVKDRSTINTATGEFELIIEEDEENSAIYSGSFTPSNKQVTSFIIQGSYTNYYTKSSNDFMVLIEIDGNKYEFSSELYAQSKYLYEYLKITDDNFYSPQSLDDLATQWSISAAFKMNNELYINKYQLVYKYKGNLNYETLEDFYNNEIGKVEELYNNNMETNEFINFNFIMTRWPLKKNIKHFNLSVSLEDSSYNYSNIDSKGSFNVYNFYSDSNEYYIDYAIKINGTWYKSKDEYKYKYNYSTKTWENIETNNLTFSSHTAPLSTTSIELNGNNKTIRNITNSADNSIGTNNRSGLFKNLYNANISNLNIDNASIYSNNGTSTYKIGLLSENIYDSDIDNVKVTNLKVYPSYYNNHIGVISSYIEGTEVKNSTVKGIIYGDNVGESSSITSTIGVLANEGLNSSFIDNTVEVQNEAAHLSGIVDIMKYESSKEEAPEEIKIKGNNIKISTIDTDNKYNANKLNGIADIVYGKDEEDTIPVKLEDNTVDFDIKGGFTITLTGGVREGKEITTISNNKIDFNVTKHTGDHYSKLVSEYFESCYSLTNLPQYPNEAQYSFNANEKCPFSTEEKYLEEIQRIKGLISIHSETRLEKKLLINYPAVLRTVSGLFNSNSVSENLNVKDNDVGIYFPNEGTGFNFLLPLGEKITTEKTSEVKVIFDNNKVDYDVVFHSIATFGEDEEIYRHQWSGLNFVSGTPPYYTNINIDIEAKNNEFVGSIIGMASTTYLTQLISGSNSNSENSSISVFSSMQNSEDLFHNNKIDLTISENVYGYYSLFGDNYGKIYSNEIKINRVVSPTFIKFYESKELNAQCYSMPVPFYSVEETEEYINNEYFGDYLVTNNFGEIKNNTINGNISLTSINTPNGIISNNNYNISSNLKANKRENNLYFLVLQQTPLVGINAGVLEKMEINLDLLDFKWVSIETAYYNTEIITNSSGFITLLNHSGATIKDVHLNIKEVRGDGICEMYGVFDPILKNAENVAFSPFVFANLGTIENSSFKGDANFKIENCGSETEINNINVGLIAAVNAGTISNTFVDGSLNINSAGFPQGENLYFGSLIGANAGALLNSYSSVDLSNNQSNLMGGLTGLNFNSDTTFGAKSVEEEINELTNIFNTVLSHFEIPLPPISGLNLTYTTTNSYWSPEISGISGVSNQTEKTAAEMLLQSSYVGFDFNNIWQMNPNTGYPTLR